MTIRTTTYPRLVVPITTPYDCDGCGETFEADWLPVEEKRQGVPDVGPILCGKCQSNEGK